jgi:hypothetical protein
MIRKRLPILAGLLIVWSFAFAGTALAAAPANDLKSGAVSLSVPDTLTLDTSEATTDPDDAAMNPGECGAPATDASVWYTLTGSGSWVAIDVSESTYSAGVLVTTGDPDNSFVTCGPGAVAWLAESGVTYAILVIDDQQDGAGNGGTLDLSVEEIPPPPEVSLTVNPKGVFDAHTGGALVRGTVTCTGGSADFSFIDVFMRQKSGRFFIDGEGFIEGFTCDGTTQPWSVDIFPFNGVFKGGRTATVTFAVACGEFLCGEGFDESIVSLSSKKK